MLTNTHRADWSKSAKSYVENLIRALGAANVAVLGISGGSSGQLGLWFSCGQFRDQLVDDDADTYGLAAWAIPAVEQCAIAQRVVTFFTGAAAWHGHCISGHCSSWDSHGCGVM